MNKMTRFERLTDELLLGKLPEALPEEMAEVIRQIGMELASGLGPDVGKVRLALKALNNQRLFAPSLDLAEHWATQRGFDPEVEKRRVQALIELSNFDRAESLALEALPKAKALGSVQADFEVGEYLGQLGRIAKQRFVQSGDIKQLELAIDWYAKRYLDSNDRPYFQGINIVALVAAMGRKHPSAKVAKDIQLPALAASVLKHVKGKIKKTSDPWLLATASEASLALGKSDAAELWLHRFLLHPETQAFHIESYSRQLREIWQGNSLADKTCADLLCDVIDRHVMRTQFRWSISPAMLRTVQQDPQSLEKNFTGERTFTVEVVQKMLKQCAGIGCVTDSSGRRLGTGFLVSAAELGVESAEEWVFVTNNHVIGENTSGAISPSQAWVTFELECVEKGKPISHKISSNVLFASPPGALGKPNLGRLDFTVLALETWPERGIALYINTNLPALSYKTKVFVVGHPSGDALQLSLHDSQLLDVCDEELLVHYRTPTERGSSGSPVFNTNWEVVALHHAGSQETPRLRGTGSYEANEGISMRAISDAIRKTTEKENKER
jgi:hypothetical protein